MSESELLKLKEEIKKELKAEMNMGRRKDTVWEVVKKEYKEKFKEINKIPGDTHSFEDAMRTLIRAKYGVRNVVNIEASYEEVKSIVENILKALQPNVERVN